VLELPTHTIYSSQTQMGDQLVICAAEEMEQHLIQSPAIQDPVILGPVDQLDAQTK
jgi:hypothetical protein